MQALFTQGYGGVHQKDTKIEFVPESWDTGKIESYFLVKTGGTPSRNIERYWTGGTIPWVKTTEINYNVIASTEEFITEEGMRNSSAKLLSKGSILLAMYGQGVTRGKVAILGVDATCNQACAVIKALGDSLVDPKYLFYFLTFRYESIRALAHGGQQQNLNLDIVRNIPIAFPKDIRDQREIVYILEGIDAKIDLHKRKQVVLESLFKSALHKLITGEIHVGDLDLSAIRNGGTL
jgi:type I restriction enzyme S subunit